MRVVRGVRLYQLVMCLVATVLPFGVKAAGHDSHSSAPIPPEILERAIGLRAGTGSARQKVTTSSLRAQAFYDQGLAYLHSFVWVEAARSFHQSLRVDPHLGMAYLGLADAYIGLQNVPSARAALENAESLKQYMNGAERTWLEIRKREVEYLEEPSDPERYRAYRKTVDDASEANPRDPWLWVQRGLAVEASPFTHGQASGAESLGFYKKALALDPDNLAAFHYAIHANENLGNIKEALAESATYARLAYSIPHAHHMHGHALMRMGRTQEAIREFEKTNELEENYYQTEKIPPAYDWHHAHNLQLMAMNFELLGQMKTAERLLREAFSLPAYTEFLAYNRRAWPEFLLDRGRYEDALNACREMQNSEWPLARMAARTLAGEAELGLENLDEAQRELALAEQEGRSIPERIAVALPYPSTLQAAILLRLNRTQEGEGIYVKVEHSVMSMPGPDGWVAAIFVLDSIARDAREVGDWPLAQYTAEQMIQHDPYFAGGHFAIGLVAEHAGESEGARQMFLKAESLWSRADSDLPELYLVREKLK